MSRLDLKSSNRLTYAEVSRDPRLMEQLVRDARRARSEAIYRMLAAAVRAGAKLLSNAGRHVNAALAKTHPPARHC
jgi:hypothetical protein